MPAYDDDLANPRPWGTWSARQLWTKTAWKNNADFAEDMGVAIMNTRSGQHIVNAHGGNGFRANIGKNVFENAFGYPAESPFDGGNLMRCWGTSSPEWSFLFWSSDTIKIPCDMTRGSSGGPLAERLRRHLGYLNGVNSRIDRSSARRSCSRRTSTTRRCRYTTPRASSRARALLLAGCGSGSAPPSREVPFKLVSTEGRTLRLTVEAGGPPCDSVRKVAVRETPSTVTVTVTTGPEPDAKCGPGVDLP